VQMPDNLEEPAHRLMRQIALQGPWAAKLAAVAEGLPPRRGADWYFTVPCAWNLSCSRAVAGCLRSAAAESSNRCGVNSSSTPADAPRRSVSGSVWSAAGCGASSGFADSIRFH
jgi:trans-aconitate 2-methyltransferase